MAYPSTIYFILSDDIKEDEGYELIVRSGKIILKAKNSSGLFYGVQTLRQMLPKEIESAFPNNKTAWVIKNVDIKDAPRFEYRGMHLDVSRSFFPVKFIKKYIDLIAFHKMNKFHWHLTDNQGWRLEIKAYPKLTEIGSRRTATVVGHTLDRNRLYDGKIHKGFYTQKEVREMIKYAAERHVEIIPEIDIPGHGTPMIAAYPELSCKKHDKPLDVTRDFGIFLEVLCPTEVTFNFLDGVFKEVAELFPSKYIHIGGDEVLKDEWASCASCKVLMKKNNLKDLHELQSYFVRRVEKIVNGYGRTIIGWDEILEGGMNKSAVIMSWRGMKGGITAAKGGHDVIMTPATHVYFDQYQSLSTDEPMSIHAISELKNVYSFNPHAPELSEKERSFIKGAQGNVWSEYIHDGKRVEYAVLPRMSALSEVIWSPHKKQNWQGFLGRLEGLFDRFDAMNLTASRAVYKVKITGDITPKGDMKMTLGVEGKNTIIRYTLDGSKPTWKSKIYKAPLVFSKSVTVRAVGQNTITGALYGDSILSFSQHLAFGKKIMVGAAVGSSILTDGLLGRDRIFQNAEWQSVWGKDFIGIIDLENSTGVHEVSVGMNAGLYRQLYPAKSFEILTSNDQKTWVSRGKLTAAQIENMGSVLTVKFKKAKARYVKLIAENNGKYFSPQYQEMRDTALHIDEISVK
jgi:hexosaminidase